MNKLIILLCSVTVCTSLFAQDGSLDPLKAPAMPASSIIGAQTNEVTRPKSLKGLETALLNNGLSNNGLVIPNSFALELNPYMLGPLKNFNYLTYLDSTFSVKSMFQNFSVSVSTTQNFSVNDTQMASAMGFGFRTIILNGKVNPAIARAYTVSLKNNVNFIDITGGIAAIIKNVLSDSTKTINDVIDLIKKNIKHGTLEIDSVNFRVVLDILEQSNPDLPPNELIKDFDKQFTLRAVIPNFEELQILLHDVKMNRYGWRWDIQGAVGTTYPTNSFNYSVVPRWGIWTNISYKPLSGKKKNDVKRNSLTKISNFEFVGMFRLIQNNNAFYRQFAPEDSTFKAGNFIDFGGRIVYEYKKFTAEAEAVYRINSTKSNNETLSKNSVKYVVNLNYNIKDNIVFSYYLGKDFDQANLTNGNLISGLSINFGFGDVKVSDLANVK